ncbi:SDR family NAD(P)-dependent oxidoreductase [Bermanella marisrubri]|uniref:Short chain dehydrogenase n=1 Tax=Bermanella marisrubri TaxID=207949 RepID=Q1N298_9GAMM|nr:SDR family NAD(P)-dependent oxidoreductase [Bermanella marisrubri]EAT12266.1 short chain dehydrogenase [Bermanella marisrubri]QIZ85357.1 SDR family NAD(P)-dependent oxidoreductase [Bermanella marisrubri]
MQKASSKIVLITGAASGLGLEMSKVFIKKGHQVIMVDLQIDKLKQEAKELGVNAFAYELDLTNGDSVSQLVDDITKQFKTLDVLVNNAGITHRSLAEQTDIKVIEKVMAVDYLGPVRLAQSCLPLLSESKGDVINIGSMAGWMPVLGRAGYCAAKSALHQYFEVMRCEVSRLNVSVLMVYPSFLDTPIETNALSGNGEKAKHKRSMIGRMGNPSELAERIYEAYEERKERLFPDTFTFIASILYKIAPKIFLRAMTKKFASELEQ